MDFIARHLGPDAKESKDMLARVGYDSVEALVTSAIPQSIRSEEHTSELQSPQ